ncbi:hypothetical protein GW17_00012213 [Ensete ventricosum]|nr:hypothetical protein GW17_00012213 [Ensete ventricosum]
MKDLHCEGQKEDNILDLKNGISSVARDDPTRINQIDRKKEHLETLEGNVREEKEKRMEGPLGLDGCLCENLIRGILLMALLRLRSSPIALERRPKGCGEEKGALRD